MKSVLTVFLTAQMNIFETVNTRIESGHGYLVTIIGLVAVFSGLLVLWAVTAGLPKFIAKIEKNPASKRSEERAAEGGKTEADTREAVAAAIGVALCCELEEEEISVITLRHIEQEMSPWVVASRPTTMRHS